MNLPKSSIAQLELVRRCVDGQASEEELAQLEDMLRSDSAFRKNYLRYLNVDMALATLPNSSNRPVGTAEPPLRQDLPTIHRRWFSSPRVAGWLVIGAALLLLVGALFYQSIHGDHDAPPIPLAYQDGAAPVDVSDTGVAVLTRVAGLQGTSIEAWRVGQTIPPGSMAWDAGLLQLEFYGGATVVAEGPAEIEILDEARVVCHRGRLRAHVPEPARGFAVLAPSFELVDLGTEFGLNVSSSGRAEVHVFDGKVELYDAQSNRRADTRRELNAGDALTVERDGTSQPTAARDADFVTPRRLGTMTAVHRQQQLRDWQAFRDSLHNDPRVVAYFPFDRSDSEDRLLIGDGADDQKIEGAIVGCEWSQGRWPGKSSLQFKRPGDRVRITIPGQFKSLTYSSWVRVDGLDRLRNSLLLTDGFAKHGIHWQIRNDGSLTLGMRYANRRAHTYHTGPIFNLFRLGQWVHLATVYDNHQERVTHYVNGEPIARQRLKRFAAGELKIGKATIGNWSGREAADVRNFNGCMDELIVFAAALDDQQVRQIYEVGRP
ncbi:LamG-like jellyroll fold domain-containing protein [Roseimaritima ulvae]|uniref:FecR protein n=1 Tax=Roseimaritima ulvae TaxID=980254 RepID=A0A5B9QJS4_9BACT|nr:LamG-like jellyroll fold domain-containing protein [Roseimaritima ulvae]QEG39308.1 FecR protein [Roseimaritima ulvae]